MGRLTNEPSRRTVDRALDELDTAGLVETHRNRYELTVRGRLVYRKYR